MKNLDAIHDPNFIGVIARQSDPQLKRPGGLVSESKKIYRHFGGVYKEQAKKWQFASGAEIIFAAIPDDKEETLGEWQGSQLCRLMIDEAAEWSETTVLYMLSRIRSTTYTGHKQLILTCNPRMDSYLYKWVEFSLDEDGVPKPGTENRIRWMVNLSGTTYWGDSKEELEKHRGNLSDDEFQPKSVRFIPMTVKIISGLC